MPTIIAPKKTGRNTRPVDPQTGLTRRARSLAAKITSAGLCVRSNDDAWFQLYPTERKARALCAGCPVIAACFRSAVIEDALTLVNNGGTLEDLATVRGGRPPNARRPYVLALMKQIRQAAPAEQEVAA